MIETVGSHLQFALLLHHSCEIGVVKMLSTFPATFTRSRITFSAGGRYGTLGGYFEF